MTPKAVSVKLQDMEVKVSQFDSQSNPDKLSTNEKFIDMPTTGFDEIRQAINHP